MECRLKRNVTQIGMSLQIEYHLNWNTKYIEKGVIPKTSNSASIGQISILFSWLRTSCFSLFCLTSFCLFSDTVAEVVLGAALILLIRNSGFFGVLSCLSLGDSVTFSLPSAVLLLAPFVVSLKDGGGAGSSGLWPSIPFFEAFFFPSPSFPIARYLCWFSCLCRRSSSFLFWGQAPSGLDYWTAFAYFPGETSATPWAWLFPFACSRYLVLFPSVLSSRERNWLFLLESFFSTLVTRFDMYLHTEFLNVTVTRLCDRAKISWLCARSCDFYALI